MGQRANLVIVNETGYDVYYCHWCANSLEASIFWGPEIAIKFVQQQTPNADWLDTTWSEGCVLVDTQHKVLLINGGEDILYDIPLRRLYMELLKIVWQGWMVQWAKDDLLDIADYLGLPRSDFTGNKSKKRDVDESWLDISNSKWPDSLPINIGSIRQLDGTIQIFPVWKRSHYDIIPSDLDLVKALERHEGYSEWTYPRDIFPNFGFHVDISQKRVSLWVSNYPGLVERNQELWDGWEIEWLGDNFEKHIELTKNRLELPPIQHTEEDILALSKILLREEYNPLEAIDILQQHAKEKGWSFEVNPHAFTHNPLEMNVDRRKIIFAKAIQSWRESQSKQE